MKKVTFDPTRCLACKSCELQCAVEHSQSKTLFGAINEYPLPQARVRVVAANGMAVPLQCRHCEDAPCVSVCKTGAITRPTSEALVQTRPELCVGCKLCILVCPFGIIEESKEGEILLPNCDLCSERLKLNKEPACVWACPTHALKFEEIEKEVSAITE